MDSTTWIIVFIVLVSIAVLYGVKAAARVVLLVTVLGAITVAGTVYWRTRPKPVPLAAYHQPPSDLAPHMQSPSPPPEQQFALKADTLGEPVQAFIAHHPNAMGGDVEGSGGFKYNWGKCRVTANTCVLENLTIADVPLEGVIYSFYSGHLISIQGHFPDDKFEQVLGAIVTKYGPPACVGDCKGSVRRWERTTAKSTIGLDLSMFYFWDGAEQPPPEGPQQERANKDF